MELVLLYLSNPLFVSSVLCTELRREGFTTNMYKQMLILKLQFKLNVWAGIVGNCLVGPFILPACLIGAVYRDFIQNTFPALLYENVSLKIRKKHVVYAIHIGMYLCF